MMLFKYLLPNPGKLLISFRIRPCNLSRACLLMIRDMFPVFFPLSESWFLMILHIFMWHILSREFFCHSGQQCILSAVSPYSALFPVFHSGIILSHLLHFYYFFHFLVSNGTPSRNTIGEGIFVVRRCDTSSAHVTVLAHLHANFLYVLPCFILVRYHTVRDKPITTTEDT